MADLDDRYYRDDVTAAPDSKAASSKSGGRKKKKKNGCGFFLLLILLAAGAAAGLQASGAVDLRPYVFMLVPRIPYVGEPLKDLLAIPDIYAMTADERRRVELDEWENRIAAAVRLMDERERHLNALSDDLGALERVIESEREEIASRLEDLSEDAANTGAAGAPAGMDTDIADIQETIRTFQDMSPRNAASILERLDEELAVAVLDGLSPDARGVLLGRMDADIAARLTEQLSELQRRRAREQP